MLDGDGVAQALAQSQPRADASQSGHGRGRIGARARRPVSHISQAYPDRVEVRGRDLTADLMGRLTFTEYFHLLLTGDEPTEDQRFFLDLLLVAIAEHGLMPTNVAARMTLAADPDSLQGAVAAGILGCGPVILGTADACARLLDAARSAWPPASSPSRWPPRSPREHPRGRASGSGLRPPGPPPGRPARRADPRARRRARRERPARAARPLPARRRRRGVGQAADDERLDADRGGHARPRLPAPVVKAIPILARTAGLLAHLAEEQRAADRLPDGGRGGGGDRLRARQLTSRATRPWEEQLAADDAAYREQLALPVRALALLPREAAPGSRPAAASPRSPSCR